MDRFTFGIATVLCVLTGLAVIVERYQMEKIMENLRNETNEEEKWGLRMMLREKRNLLNDTVDLSVLFALIVIIWGTYGQ